MTHIRLSFLVALVAVSACECGGTTLGEIKCGDGTCTASRENCSNCVEDCGCDADQRCDSEVNQCVAKCGDGACLAVDGENCSTCVADCGCDLVSTCSDGQCVTDCGDGSCDAVKNENCGTCAADCTCGADQECAENACRDVCGNGTCQAGLGEGCTTCAADCACVGAGNVCTANACAQACGDGTCEASRGENCDTCEADCGCDGGEACNAGTCESTSGCSQSVACTVSIAHTNDLKVNAGAGNTWWPTVGTMSDGAVYVGYGRSNPAGGDDDFAVARLNGSSFTQRTSASNDAYTTGERHLIQTSASRLTALYDKTGGGSHVMATRSTDGGGSWTTPVQVDKAATSQNASNIAAAYDGSTLHVAYRGRAASCPSSGSCYEVFYQSSSDGGGTWSDAQRISNDTDQDDEVGIAVDGQVVVIAWVTFRGDVRVARSNNGGRLFSSQRQVNDVAGGAENYGRQMVAVKGNKVHLVWSDSRDGNSEGDLFMDTSSDGGLTWGTDVALPGASSRYDESPEIRFAPDGRAWVVWQRYASGVGYDVYATATRDGTCFCEGVRINQQTAEDQSNIAFAIDSTGKLHVAWRNEVPDSDWAIGYNAATPQ